MFSQSGINDSSGVFRVKINRLDILCEGALTQFFRRWSTLTALFWLTPKHGSLLWREPLLRIGDQWPFRSRAGRRSFREGYTERLVKRHNVPPFKGASTGMRRQADDVTRIDEARCAAHANAGNLKRQLEQRCNDDAERLPGFRGDSIRSYTGARFTFVTICAGREHYVPSERSTLCPSAIYRCRSRVMNAESFHRREAKLQISLARSYTPNSTVLGL